MATGYTGEQLAEAVAGAVSWNEVLRRLGLPVTGERRRSLQRAAAELGLDVDHFTHRSHWVKYSDDAIARAVADSRSLREVAERLGARPATGTLTHLRRRISAAGVDASHFPGLDRPVIELAFSEAQLAQAAGQSRSIRGMAQRLGVGDDRATRAALRREVTRLGIPVTHFSHSRIALPDDLLTEAVAAGTSFASVMRRLGLDVNEANRRRVRRLTHQLGLDTAHFTRPPRSITIPAPRRPAPEAVLRVRGPGSSRVNRERLHRALLALGVPHRCAGCGNPGQWLERPITLQIDHVNGDWRDNRAENLRRLCPNCHALTDTWCRPRRARAGAATMD